MEVCDTVQEAMIKTILKKKKCKKSKCVSEEALVLKKKKESGDFPGDLVVKNLPCNAEDVGSVPGQ